MPNTLSDLMLNTLARPLVPNSVTQQRAQVYRDRALIVSAAADANGRIYPVTRLPAEARIWDVWVFNDVIANGTDWDLGLYVAGDWVQGDQAIKDINIYCDGLSMAVARNFAVSVDPAQASRAASDGLAAVGSAYNVLGQTMTGSTSITGLQRGRFVWQDAGDAVAPRPGTMYDLCWTATVVGDGGSVLTVVEYSFGT